MAREQKNKSSQETEEVVEETSSGVETNVDEEALDDLLADIDDVLEENAEDFVAAFIQRGGQ